MRIKQNPSPSWFSFVGQRWFCSVDFVSLVKDGDKQGHVKHGRTTETIDSSDREFRSPTTQTKKSLIVAYPKSGFSITNRLKYFHEGKEGQRCRSRASLACALEKYEQTGKLGAQNWEMKTLLNLLFIFIHFLLSEQLFSHNFWCSYSYDYCRVVKRNTGGKKSNPKRLI